MYPSTSKTHTVEFTTLVAIKYVKKKREKNAAEKTRSCIPELRNRHSPGLLLLFMVMTYEYDYIPVKLLTLGQEDFKNESTTTIHYHCLNGDQGIDRELCDVTRRAPRRQVRSYEN